MRAVEADPHLAAPYHNPTLAIPIHQLLQNGIQWCVVGREGEAECQGPPGA
jgi:hypothetical protein